MTRRAWITPANVPSSRYCRLLEIPNSPAWIGIVSGALLQLAQEWNWEQTDGITPTEAANAALDMLRDFWDSGTGGCAMDVRQNSTNPCSLEKLEAGSWTEFADISLCAPQVRLGSSGQLQYSTDGGETWTDAPSPPITPVTGDTPEDRRCNASYSAVAVIEATWTQFDAMYGSGASTLINLAELIAIIAVFIFYKPAIFLVFEFFETFEAAWADLTGQTFDATTREQLACILYCNSTESDGVVTFNHAAVAADVEALEAIPLNIFNMVRYLLFFIDQDGLNRAGATNTASGMTCDCPDCPVLWCREFDFTADDHDFATYAGGYAQYVAGSGFRGRLSPGTPGGDALSLRSVTFPASGTVTRVEFDFQAAWGGTNPRILIGTSSANWIETNTDEGTTTITQVVDSPFTGTALFFNLDMNVGDIPAQEFWGSQFLTAIRLIGTGDNPWGTDNCP